MECNHYRICESTMACIPFAHPFYQTYIADTRGAFYSTKTCRQLIDEACLQRGASRRGKCDAITELLKIKRNTPIPLCFDKNICAIPTKSPKHWDCIWYFYAHVKDICETEQNSVIILSNGERLTLNTSTYHIRQQLLKAGHILAKFQLAT